jgi:hypothetical protein
MNIIIIFLIFCIVLFFYLHIFFHLKTNNELEIYKIPQPTKKQFEEICDLRQPVLFDYNGDCNNKLEEVCNMENINKNYSGFDVKIRNLNKDNNKDNNKEMYSIISCKKTKELIEKDKDSKYLFETNSDFLEETDLIKMYKLNDKFLKPYMNLSCDYDILFASTNTTTPFRYELNYRNFFLVTEGEIQVKLAPPKNTKYLYMEKDYENMEFRSPVNPWNVQEQYEADFSKIRCLDTTVKKGQILYVPAFWWYSIKFGENTTVCSFKYRTYMNTLAISDKLISRFLLLQNIKCKM